MEKDNQSIKNRIERDKELILEQLKKSPIIQIACNKCNISRSTFYRWKNEDNDFSEKSEKAILEGLHLINDLAESQLITAIKDRNLTSIIFWLKSHHDSYKNKMELSGKVEIENKELTLEQKELIEKAIKLAGLDQQ